MLGCHPTLCLLSFEHYMRWLRDGEFRDTTKLLAFPTELYRYGEKYGES